jgi:hypothetical protein
MKDKGSDYISLATYPFAFILHPFPDINCVERAEQAGQAGTNLSSSIWQQVSFLTSFSPGPGLLLVDPGRS